MTMSFINGHLPTATTDNNIDHPMINKSQLALIGFTSTPKRTTGDYSVQDGVSSSRGTAYVNVDIGPATMRMTLGYKDFFVWTDSETGLLSLGQPFKVTKVLEFPAAPYMTGSILRNISMSANSLEFGTVTTGVPATTFWDNVLSGIARF